MIAVSIESGFMGHSKASNHLSLCILTLTDPPVTIDPRPGGKVP